MPATKKMKLLLPIKTSKGLFVPQARVEEEEDRKIYDEPEEDEDVIVNYGSDADESAHEGATDKTRKQNSNHTSSTLEGNKEDDGMEERLTTVEKMALEEAKAKELKISIANYAQSAIENPQENIGNLRHLRLLLADPICQAKPLLADYVVVSLCEVFKDILPSYKIRLATDAEKHQLAKKETRRLREYEEALLVSYRKYIAVLRDAMLPTGKSKEKWRRGEHKKRNKDADVVFSNRLLAIRCLSQLLGSHPNFNEASEIITRLTPCLNSRSADVSAAAASAFRQLFTDDRSGEATLQAVKTICRFACSLASARKAVHGELLEVLASVRLDLPPPPPRGSADQEGGGSFNRMTHKEKVAKLSRQERKRGKRTAAEAAGLEELRGRESAAVRARRQQRCAELLLHLYVHVLRAKPGARPLAAALAGLNRLALRVNMDLLPDLFKALGDLLDWPDLSASHSLQVVNTALILLTEEGEALTLDPRRFYLHLYSRLDRLVRCHPELSAQLGDTLRLALVDRRRHLPPRRPVSFLRRLLESCCSASASGAIGEAALVDLLTCAGRLFAVFPRAHHLLEADGDADSGPLSSMAVTASAADADPDLGGGGSGFDSCVPALRRLSTSHASLRVRQLANRLLRLDFTGFPAAYTTSRQQGAQETDGATEEADAGSSIMSKKHNRSNTNKSSKKTGKRSFGKRTGGTRNAGGGRFQRRPKRRTN